MSIEQEAMQMKTAYSKWNMYDFLPCLDDKSYAIKLKKDAPKEMREAFDKMMKKRDRPAKEGIFVD